MKSAPADRPGHLARPRGPLRRLGAPLLGLLVGLALVEFSLGLLARLTAPDTRAGGPLAPGDGLTVLCLGDSHTFGWNVRPEDAWPARLEQLLRRHDSAARVVNLGVAGKHSGHLVEELPEHLERYRPQLVLALIGANNAWSRGALRGERPQEGFFDRLRLVRLARIAAQRVTGSRASRGESGSERGSARDFSRVRVRAEDPGAGSDQVLERVELEGQQALVRSVDREGRAIEYLIGGGLLGEDEDDLLHAWLRSDLAELAELCRSQGTRLVLLTYADDTGSVLPRVNAGIRLGARAAGVPLVDQGSDFAPFLEEFGRDRLLFHDAHPRRDGYEILAAQIHDALVAEGLWAAPPVGDPANALRGRPAAAPRLALGPDGRSLELGFEAGIEYTLLFSRATEPGFRLKDLHLPIVRDELFEQARTWEGLEGRFDASGEARVALPGELLVALEAGPAHALLVVRTPYWEVLDLGGPLRLEAP